MVAKLNQCRSRTVTEQSGCQLLIKHVNTDGVSWTRNVIYCRPSLRRTSNVQVTSCACYLSSFYGPRYLKHRTSETSYHHPRTQTDIAENNTTLAGWHRDTAYVVFDVARDQRTVAQVLPHRGGGTLKMQDMKLQDMTVTFIFHFDTLLSVIFWPCVYLCSIH